MSCRSSRCAASTAQVSSVMQASECSSSAARSTAASSSVQPSASGPLLTRAISSSETPTLRARTARCPHSYSARHSQPVRRMAISRRRGESTPVTARATVKGIHWRRRSGCRISVSKVLPVALEPMLAMRSRDSASRSPEGRGRMRGDDGLTP